MNTKEVVIYIDFMLVCQLRSANEANYAPMLIIKAAKTIDK